LWGELGGFIRDVRRDPGVDRVYSTAAHETAHQWWGGSVRVLNEALSDYVRIACLDEAFGRDRAADVVREGTRSYFRQRDRTLEDERSLRLGGQHDNRFALMWRLRQLLGEAVVNAPLRDIVHEFANRTDRTPTPAHVREALQQHPSPNLHPIVADVFDHITLHPIRAHDARASKMADGRYRVTLSGDLRKSYGDAQGADTPAPLTGYVDYLDVGVYGEDGKMLSLTTHRITDPTRELLMIVDGEPRTVVLDPLFTLLDPDLADNRVAVSPER
jgi:ABC-2 type transport system permease protein